jgi:hypothetical protein
MLVRLPQGAGTRLLDWAFRATTQRESLWMWCPPVRPLAWNPVPAASFHW